MVAWRVAKSLLHLRDQVNAAAPHRSKSDDGTIGDASHQTRNSDHNPWVVLGRDHVVTAMDLTHDPHGGFDSYKFAESLRTNQPRDKRIKYVISNRKIWSPSISSSWRPYGGSNPHDRHVHISVVPTWAADGVADWSFKLPGADINAPPRENRAVLRMGSTGADVGYLQTLLGIPVTNKFTKDVDTAVRAFQLQKGLLVDGIVGSHTWEALLTASPPVEVDPRPAPQAPPVAMMHQGRGSWYSQFHGEYVWHDTGDKPNSNALGVPDDYQGISFMNAGTLGDWFLVEAPNGKRSIEQQTDIGPNKWTGRLIDISAAAAERFGYSPRNFPTNGVFKWTPISDPTQVAGLDEKEQAKKYRIIRLASK